MTNDRTPFIVNGGTMLSLVETYEHHNTATYETWDQFMTKYGADNIYADNKVQGLTFNSNPPTDWIHKSRNPVNVFTPKPKTPERKEMNNLPTLLGNDNFTQMIECPITATLFTIHFAYVEHINDNTIIVWIPNKALEEGYVPPTDCTKLKISEYNNLKKSITTPPNPTELTEQRKTIMTAIDTVDNMLAENPTNEELIAEHINLVEQLTDIEEQITNINATQ